MKLDPAERRFPQLDERAFYIRCYFDLVEFPPRKELSQFPGALSQRPHSRLSAVLAKQRRRLRQVIAGVSAKLATANRTTVQRRQPASQANRPEGEIRQWQLPGAASFDFSSRQQQQAEHRVRDFLLRQNPFGDFTDHRQPGTQSVVTLRAMKRFK